jgi:hypothetical protein
MQPRKLKIILTLLISLLVLFASIYGYFIPSVYQDNEPIKTIFQSNDFITLITFIPLIIVVFIRSKSHHDALNELTWAGLIWYLFYNYLYYLFGAHFNDLYLIYLLITVMSIPLLIMTVQDVIKRLSFIHPLNPLKRSVLMIYLWFIALGLSVVYVMQSITYILTDELPSIITLSGHVTSIVFSLDAMMVILVFIYIALLIKKKNPLGIALGWIVNLKGAIYMMVMTYASYQTGSKEFVLWFSIMILSILMLIIVYPSIQNITKQHISKEE